ncbi:acyltransferase family protein [Microbacterium sp. zg.Y625]|uniref:acyltransferase family protein n=1 Tax=Microbacterium jiangjiandongii TaxID=3049071 RepID=UPI00214BF7EB|nr:MULTISPECIES: acyltransferase family protein [unclassified Microbacterium]MCR2793903.1 acyltransferase family protein [Microbacterium sp. zg.Y625]WIM26237.1 acyltransferase family protein [Microbacterium sp. zg-Y625]
MQTSHPVTTARATQRVTWLDGARGIAIILVVLFHAGMFTVPTGLASPWWEPLNLVFALLRMPLFFLVAGMLAVGAVQRSWPALWRTRLAVLVWVFVVWTVLRFAYYQVIPEPIDLNQSSWLDFVLSIVRPSNGLWFLFALALFLVAAKALHGRVNRWIVLAIATVASSVAHGGFTFGNVTYDGIMKYFVFFMLGLYLREPIIRFVHRRRWPAAVALLVVFAAAIALRGATGWFVDAATAVPVGLVAVAFGLCLSRNLARTPFTRPLSRPLEHLGRRTLQVYVTHILLLSTFTSVLVPSADTGVLTMLQPVMPVLMSAIAIALSLLVAAGCERVPVLRLLYVAPAWFARDRAGDRRG